MTRWFATIAVLFVLAGTSLGVEEDWFIRTGVNGVWSNNVRHPACKKLVRRAAHSIPTCLAFTAQDDWTVLDGGNSIWSTDAVPIVAVKGLALANAGHKIRWVAFTPQGGWVLLYDKRSYAAEGVPESLRARLDAVVKGGDGLRSIAFGPNGGYVIVGDANVATDGIPDALDKTLRDHVSKRIPIRCVAFTSRGAWFVIDDRNECQASDTDHPAYKKLQELRDSGQVLQWIAFAPGDYPGGMILERKAGNRIKAVLECTVTAPDGGVGEWMVCAAQAPTLDRQRDVATTLTPGGKLTAELSVLKRGLLVARLRNQPDGFQVKLAIDATMMTTRLRPRVPSDPPLKAELESGLVRHYTRDSPMADFKTQTFQDWLDLAKLRRNAGESDMAIARRVFRHLSRNLTYEWYDGMDLRASAACRNGKADCAGMSNLFVATLRAAGVPARAVSGRHARSEKLSAQLGNARATQRHVCAEFFVRSVGWVPVDVNLAVVERRRGDGAYFGNDNGEFLVMHLDTDMVIDSIVTGRTSLPTLQGCCWWRRGGTARPDQLRERWTVE